MTAYVLAARRTAVMPRGGAFARLHPHDLAAPVIRAVLADAGLQPDDVDELILSNALGGGGNPARLAALAAGLPERVAGLSIDRQCAGGLDAIRLGAAMVASGQARVVIAGGAESYSRRPLRLRTDPDGGEPVAYDAPPFTPWPDRNPDMAQAASDMAERLGITAQRQAEWAVESHAKAMAADLSDEIVALPEGASDAFTRALTLQAALRAPKVAENITKATMAVAADAAAFVVISAKPMPGAAIIRATATLGADPMGPGLSPLPAIRAVLARAQLTAANFNHVEMMEAFAAQALACIQQAGFDPNMVNRKGGALARGHPIGASGAILAVRLFHDLETAPGLAAIAAAGGIGSALILEGV
jgi:acetyl-CoA C-acetyltransferase